jgi:autotransporter-associated beta strand protein
MAEYKFGCPQCGQHILCTDAYIGTQINCPNCQKAIIVSRPKAAAAPQAAIQPAPVERRSSSSILRIAVIAAIACGVCAGLVIGGFNYFSQQRAQQKELQQAQKKKAAPKKKNVNAAATNWPTNNTVTDSALMLVNDSTLQVSMDVKNTSAPVRLSVQSPNLGTMNLDAKSLASVNGHVLSLTKTLMCFGNATIDVMGKGDDTLAFGAIVGKTTGHNPAAAVTINAPSDGPELSMGSFQTGDWGQWLVLQGGGKVTITGNLTNTSNGSATLYVNGGTTVTMRGASSPHTPDPYKYDVASGTMVLDNNAALTNNTTDPGGINKFLQSHFILGAATNAFSSHIDGNYAYIFSPPAGVLVAKDNNYDAAVYLGDPDSGGGLSVDAKTTINVSNGDVGFTNSGVFTIGGQNTSGTNTYSDPIILGWTDNKGKSATLVAATGGEVDFTGELLANGSDKTAGVTVGDAAHGGIVKMTGANTYCGNTFITNGTLALGGTGSIANSAGIVLAAGATFDVSGLSSIFTLGAGQTLGNSGPTACLNGNANTGSGTVSLAYASGTPSMTVANGTLNLDNKTVFKVNNTGPALAPGGYKIISRQAGGEVRAASGLPTVGIAGGGIAIGTTAALQITDGELYLVVTAK